MSGETQSQAGARHYLHAAARIVPKLATRLERAHLLETAVHALVDELGAALARVWLPDAGTGALELAASFTRSPELLEPEVTRLDIATHPYSVGIAARTRRAVVRERLEGAPEFDQHWVSCHGLESASVLPLVVAGELRGVLSTFFREPLTPELADLLVTLATPLAALLEDVDSKQRVQRESERLRALLERAPAGIALLRGPDHVFELSNTANDHLSGRRIPLGVPAREVFSDFSDQGLLATLDGVYESGEPVVAQEVPARVQASASSPERVLYLNATYQPLRDEDGRVERIMTFAYDVSEQVLSRKRAEALTQDLQRKQALLERSEARARRLQDSGIIGVVSWSGDGRILEANDAFLGMVGYTREDLASGSLSWLDLTPVEYRELDRKALQELAREGICRPFEKEYAHKDGHRVHVLLAGATWEGSASEGVAWVVDMSARKHLEDALARQAAVLASMAEGVSVTDERGVIVYTNAAEDAMFGYEPGELIGQSVEVQNAYPPEENRRIVAEIISQLKQGLPFRGEWQNVKKDGTRFVTRGRVTPLELSGRKYFVCVQTDVTREKRDRQAAEFLARVSALLVSSLDLQTTLDRLTELLVPEQADACLVYLQGDDHGLELSAAAHADHEKRALLLELARNLSPVADAAPALSRVVTTRKSMLVPELTEQRVRRGAPDPAVLELVRLLGVSSCLVVPLVAQGRAIGAIALAVGAARPRFDASDLALAEEVARRVAGAIDNARLFELTQRERRRAEAANRAKDALLSITSHELRTPLNAILGWARMLRMGALGKEKFEQALDTIVRNAQVQVQLVDDILDVNRAMTGKLRIDRIPVELPAIVSSALDVVRPAALAKNITIESSIRLPPGATHVKGDAARLQQVFWNLLSNAVKFTPRGGHVQVELIPQETSAVLTISDDGQGIEPEFLPHVFQPFRQQDTSTTRAHGGLGLGLAIAEHLVELHGGTIEAHSGGRGAGAAFVVRLPLADEPTALGSTTPTESPRPETPSNVLHCPPELARRHVLVVDDDPDSRELVRSILLRCQVRVTTAASVADALTRLEAERPDLIVSDIGMAGQSGYDLIRAVRRLPPEKGGRAPAVALSAYTSSTERMRALMEGFTAHSGKPTDPNELVAVLASLCRSGS